MSDKVTTVEKKPSAMRTALAAATQLPIVQQFVYIGTAAVVVGGLIGVRCIAAPVDMIVRDANHLVRDIVSNPVLGVTYMTAGFGMTRAVDLLRGKAKKSAIMLGTAILGAGLSVPWFERALRNPNPVLTHMPLDNAAICATYLTIGFGAGLFANKVVGLFEKKKEPEQAA